jgi:cytochrome c peroxidase
MHNGSLRTLEEVVAFYNRGGDWHPANQDKRIKPLGLTDDEKKDLVIFLESLTDWNAVQNQSYLPLKR